MNETFLTTIVAMVASLAIVVLGILKFYSRAAKNYEGQREIVIQQREVNLDSMAESAVARIESYGTAVSASIAELEARNAIAGIPLGRNTVIDDFLEQSDSYNNASRSRMSHVNGYLDDCLNHLNGTSMDTKLFPDSPLISYDSEVGVTSERMWADAASGASLPDAGQMAGMGINSFK